MDIWSQLQFCWWGPLGRIPALSSAVAVPVAGDCHCDHWVSRRCGLLDSVLVATVTTGIKTGRAGPSLAALGVTQSVAMAHASVITNTYSLRCFLGTPSLPILIPMGFRVFLSKSQLWEDGAV